MACLGLAHAATLLASTNDVHHIQFSGVSSPQDSGVPFSVVIRAEDINGTLVTNFTGNIPLVARAWEGELPLAVSAAGPFVNGLWTGVLHVTRPGRLVRLTSTSPPGQSNPFNVEQPTVHVIHQKAKDIFWHDPSATLFASVPPDGGAYANHLVAIDPISGAVTNSYWIGDDPGQLEGASSGTFLYATWNNRKGLSRFDLDARQPGTRFEMVRFEVGDGTTAVRSIRDFAVIGGGADLVVVALEGAGTWSYASGVRREIPTFSIYDPHQLESSPDAMIYGFHPKNDFTLIRGWAHGFPVTVTNHLFGGEAGIISHKSGVLYSSAGRAVKSATFELLGDYPLVLERTGDRAWLEVDPVLDRTIFLSGRYHYLAGGQYTLKAYDRNSFERLGQFKLPRLSGEPGRLLRCGTNGLAVNAGSEILWIRTPTIQPAGSPADLVLDQSATPAPATVGNDLAVTLTVSNKGPNVATLVVLTNTLPVDGSLIRATPSIGTATPASGGVTWDITQLNAGSSATLELIMRLGSAGPMTNKAFITSYELDPDFTNNISRLTIPTQLPAQTPGLFEIKQWSEDIVYDRIRDRLLLSIADAARAGTNGIAVLNPHNGLIESFLPFAEKPAKLVISQDGRYLYVALNDAGLVRRFDLPTFTPSIDIRLGSELIYDAVYPFFARDLAVLPHSPRSIAVWQVRRAGPSAGEYGRGIAIFDDAVMRANTVELSAPAGSVALEFDEDADILYASHQVPSWDSTPQLTRCAIDANGVLLTQDFIRLQWGFSPDFEYASGKFFHPRGSALEFPIGVTATYPGSESAALVEPDAMARRVFYLTGSGKLWRLNGYEMETLNPLGSLAVSSVSGLPSSLIRCGDNGLAFRTTGGQLFIVRTGLTLPAISADLAVKMTVPRPAVAVGERASFFVSVTNRGPAFARDVILTNSYPSDVEILWTAESSGQTLLGNRNIVWSFPELAPGSEQVMGVEVRAARPGSFTLSSDVVNATADTEFQNNSALTVLSVGDQFGPESVQVIPLAVNDLVWSAGADKLIASVNTNHANWAGSLVSVDPLTLDIVVGPRLGADARQLAVSEDGTALYAALGRDVIRVDVPSLLPRQRFALDKSGAPRGIADLEVLRGSTDSILVVRTNGNDLSVYDHGVLRSNIAVLPRDTVLIEQGDRPTPVYAYTYSVGEFTRVSVDAAGAVLLDTETTVLPRATRGDLKWADGVLFDSGGLVIDPIARTRLGIVSGITNHSPLCYDPAARRMFYLSAAGSNAVLHAVDRTTLTTVGTKSITGLSGLPADLVRWGTDGLAFRTSSGQLFILRSHLVPSGHAADLALSVESSSLVAEVERTFSYSIVITNSGPNPAANGQVLIQLPRNLTSFDVATSQGITVASNHLVTASLGALDAGGTAKVTISLTPSHPGDLTIAVQGLSTSWDPVMSNNFQTVTNGLKSALAPDSGVLLNRAVTDLAYDSSSGRLYMSSGGQIMTVNPRVAQIEAYWPVPGFAGKLALSDDDRFLYVVMDRGHRVGRLDSRSGVLDFMFAPEMNDLGVAVIPGEPGIRDLAVLPGEPESYVIGGTWDLQVFDGVIVRPKRMVMMYSAENLQFTAASDIVYANAPSPAGYNRQLVSYQLTKDGAELGIQNRNIAVGSDFETDGERLFATSGEIIDPSNLLVTGRFPGLGQDSAIEPDPPYRRVFFVTKVASGWHLRAYDSVSTALIGSVPLTTMTGRPTRLVRWGIDGLAYATTSNEVFLLRSSLVDATRDTDRDGMPDYWEIRHGLNPATAADGWTDSDGDQHNNLQEFEAGTDPRDAGSSLHLVNIETANGAPHVSFSSAINRFYIIEESFELPGTSWTPASPRLIGTGGIVSVSPASNNLTGKVRFFRVRVVP